ncbi:transposase domain-containing protein [Oceaniradius stylonematis]|uniref:transposase domain-containing protein n=1 Tax=Oceaniradius stylonematis TaxID=2184161 RepID=UPI00273FD795|nr:transposase domain-containing protein [Oceaniradius stylonematis]
MARAYFTIDEILACAGGDLPATVRGINKRATKEGWRDRPGKARKRPGRGGQWEYHRDLLPASVRARLQALHDSEPDLSNTASKSACGFERLPDRHKQRALARLGVLDAVDELCAGGLTVTAAIAKAAKGGGVSPASVLRWRGRVAGRPRAQWLALLAPNYRPTTQRSTCSPEAWAALKSDYLRPEAPAFSACYRRVAALAAEKGWTLPPEHGLRRRLSAEVPRDVQVAKRKGRDAVKALYPAQKRSIAALHAMEAVNADGHKLDLFVRVPGQPTPVRVYMMALQDLYSRKILAWRLSLSENKDAVRLAIGDMVDRYGIPDHVYLDNGRAFASKWITGGTATRYRFKVRVEEPQGVLTALGVKVHWTTPYAGQSKPIERAFRDLAEDIAKHPLCAGAYTGNRPDAKPENYGNSAIDIDVLREHVDRQIAAHNARSGRRTEAASGDSFDKAFAESLAEPTTIVRWPASAQKALWLLAAERIKASKGNGEVRLFDNRYWAPALTAQAGKHLTVRFDPDRLHQPVRIYDSADRLICEAECVGTHGFTDTDAARAHAAKRSAYIKAVNAQARLHTELSAAELARLYADGAEPAPAPPRERPSVTRLAAGASAKAIEPSTDPDIDQERSFSAGLKLIAGGRE